MGHIPLRNEGKLWVSHGNWHRDRRTLQDSPSHDSLTDGTLGLSSSADGGAVG